MSLPITGFTAVPNPQMLAFMPIQSYLMMYFAGAGWQIGKRKISAIPNDQFNKMSANDLLKGFTADLRETIPTLERSMNDVTPLVKILIEQYGDFVKEAINALPAAAQTVAGALVNPKGALVPPLFGPELEKLVTGNPTQAQFLAYAKILLQQEVNKQKSSGGSVPSTVSGLSVQQAQSQAIEKQRLFELAEAKRISDLNKLKKSFVGTAPITAQVPSDFKFKKKAGQSQIMERLRLIKVIAQLAKDAKFLDSEPARKHAFERMLFEQQMLVNLLARYTF